MAHPSWISTGTAAGLGFPPKAVQLQGERHAVGSHPGSRSLMRYVSFIIFLVQYSTPARNRRTNGRITVIMARFMAVRGTPIQTLQVVVGDRVGRDLWRTKDGDDADDQRTRRQVGGTVLNSARIPIEGSFR